MTTLLIVVGVIVLTVLNAYIAVKHGKKFFSDVVEYWSWWLALILLIPPLAIVLRLVVGFIVQLILLFSVMGGEWQDYFEDTK